MENNEEYTSKELDEFIAFAKSRPNTFWESVRDFADADFIFKGYMTSSKGGERVVHQAMGVYLKDVNEK